PYTFCLQCIAKRLVVSEPAAREAAQLLVMQPSMTLRVVRRVCYGCGQTSETLVAQGNESESSPSGS
ncbi:MAG: hypothetical protein ACRDGJ_00990, partial [Candidatus Limnocylindria bacterium]